MKKRYENNSFEIWTLIYTTIFLIGFLMFLFLHNVPQYLYLVNLIVKGSTEFRFNSSAIDIFAYSLVFNLAIISVLFFSRLSKFGIVLNLILVFVIGSINGALAFYITFDSGIFGTFFLMITFLPGIIFSSVVLLLTAACSTVYCIKRKHSGDLGGLQSLKALSVYIFLVIFSSGLDAASAEVYKFLM